VPSCTVRFSTNGSGNNRSCRACLPKWWRNSSSYSDFRPFVEDSARAYLLLKDCAELVFGLCCHVFGAPSHLPPPLVLLGLAAGPGSQVQRQLHSLLATMVKLGGRRKDTPGSNAPMYFRTAATYNNNNASGPPPNPVTP
jgi:hypothetical protein